MTEVVSAVIIRAGRLLLTQRTANKDFPFRWETPGGKVEGNESHHDALRRELREELGVELGPIREQAFWVGMVKVPDKGEACVLLYCAHLPEAEQPRPLEGQGIGWFKSGEFRALGLAPGNMRCLFELESLLDQVARSGR